MNQKEVEMSMVGERGSLKYCTIKDIMYAGSFLKKKKNNNILKEREDGIPILYFAGLR